MEHEASLSRSHHSFLDYRLRRLPDSNAFFMEHRRVREGTADMEWKPNYRFERTRCLKPNEVETIALAHARDPHFGHMLHSLRLSKWSLDGNSVVLRDTQARVIGADGSDLERLQLRTASELRSFVLQHFGAEMVGKLDAAAPTLLEYLALMQKSDARAPALMSLLKDYVST